MFFRKLWLLPLLMLVVEMAWAADQPAVSVDREQVVKQRAAGRWGALIKRDYAAAYAFELPVYRSAYSLEQYQSEFGDDIAWEKVEIGQLLFEGDDVATVYLRILNDANPRVSMIQDDTTGNFQTPRIDTWVDPVDAVSAVLMRSNVMNEWSSNIVNGAETYWVVSFPTKLHYVDENAQPTQAEINGMVVPAPNANPAFIGTPAVVGPPAMAAIPAPPFTKIWTDTTFSCDTVTFFLWDRSEGGTTTGGTSISPAPPTPATSICYEVNVLAFNTTGTDPVFSSNVAKTINTSALISNEPYGWLNVALPSGTANRIQGTATGNPLGAAGNTYAGLPVIGYTIWSRSFSPTDKTKNYGHLVDHSFKRAVTPP